MNEYILQTNAISKRYGKKNVVNKVNLNIKAGEIYGLIGPNGAGKTTIMKMIAGFAAPTEGQISIFEDGDSQRRIGTLIEEPGLYRELTAFDNMKLKAMALGVYDKENVMEILQFVGLANEKRKKTKHYSLGMKQRLGIALALIGNPDFLIFDEPINGLDPEGIIEVRELILKLNQEKNMTIMISSHILEELNKVATSFGIISHGELVLELSQEELKKRCQEKVEIITSDCAGAITALESMNISKYSVVSDETIHAFECIDRIEELNRQLVSAGVGVKQIHVVGTTLEEFFLKQVGKEGGR